jgi:hypothetical protein
VSDHRLVTIDEVEMLSPAERLRLLEERTVTDLSQVDPRLLERIRADAVEALTKRQSLDDSER